MSTPAAVKTWEKTRLQNMVRHKSGGYYARLFLNGKEVWRSLKTKHYSVAESRLAEAQKEHRQHKSRIEGASSSKMNFGDAGQLHMQRLEANVSIKSGTRRYWKQILAALLKSWAGLAELEVRKITKNACREWAGGFAKKSSTTRYNNSIAMLGHIFAVAIENGVIYSNPADELPRKPVRSKQLELPSLAQFAIFIDSIRKRNGRFSVACADFAQGLAFTGCRLSEAARITWGDLDFTAGEITVKGDPIERTKNGDIRRVPMIPSARELFERMKTSREDEPKDTPVFKVRECQNAMTRAAKSIGMARITHHDLRHFFATVCIESGVDIPTVSRWLGHRDGGALAMRVYGHLRREHSIAQAQKVSFAPAAG